MRKFLFNGAVIGAATGAWSLIKQTREGKRDWLLLLMWLSWALSSSIAIATVARRSNELAQRGK